MKASAKRLAEIRAWRVAHPEQVKAANRRYRERHPDRARANYQRTKTAVRRRQRLKKYGLTDADYEFLRSVVRGVCPICQKQPAEVIDHDHSTGKVRGLLCRFGCNPGLGMFRDDPEILRRAAAYLEMFR